MTFHHQIPHIRKAHRRWLHRGFCLLTLCALWLPSTIQAEVRIDSTAIVSLQGYGVEKPQTLVYRGDQIWEGSVDITNDRWILFPDKKLNLQILQPKAVRQEDGQATVENEQYELFLQDGSQRKVIFRDQETNQGHPMLLNEGKYFMRLDLKQQTWDVFPHIDENRISAFGSSVCNGQGAHENKGYAFMLGEMLHERYQKGISPTPFHVSGVSIGGNTTGALLSRYLDLIHDGGRYVIIGLSLGNEGIHGAKDQAAIRDQFLNGIQQIVAQSRRDGKIPVVVNNYTRADFTLDDYKYVKEANLAIHTWNVPSINVLGAIDDGEGKWAADYVADPYHQNTEGHKEFMYAFPPSLFDALQQGKPQPVRHLYEHLTLRKGETLSFDPEGTLHPFTLSLKMKGKRPGKIFRFTTSEGEGCIELLPKGKLRYTSPSGKTFEAALKPLQNKSDWQYFTLTHYYAQGRTLIYHDKDLLISEPERLEAQHFQIGDKEQNTKWTLGELHLWRSGMSPEEISAHVSGKCLKSSLEIYAPLSDHARTKGLTNYAQSLNASLVIQ